jgi:hypothetical protein
MVEAVCTDADGALTALPLHHRIVLAPPMRFRVGALHFTSTPTPFNAPMLAHVPCPRPQVICMRRRSLSMLPSVVHRPRCLHTLCVYGTIFVVRCTGRLPPRSLFRLVHHWPASRVAIGAATVRIHLHMQTASLHMEHHACSMLPPDAARSPSSALPPNVPCHVQTHSVRPTSISTRRSPLLARPRDGTASAIGRQGCSPPRPMTTGGCRPLDPRQH